MNHLPNTKNRLHKVDSCLAVNSTTIHELFMHSEDIQTQTFTFGNDQYSYTVLFVYADGMISIDRFQHTILPIFNRFFAELRYPLTNDYLAEMLPLPTYHVEQFHEFIVSPLFRGQLIFFIDTIDVAHLVDVSDLPGRQPEEPGNEISIRGPKDGFVEDVATNVALVRKRLPTDSLCTEQFTVGTRSQTRVSILYINDILDPAILAELKKRIQNIQTEAIYASSQFEAYLVDEKWSLVPRFSFTGRPDFVAGSLLRGRFAVVIDGTPTVILGPVNLSFLFQSAEDEYTLYPFLIIQRLLRFLGATISLILPGLYVAIVSYHIDRIPLTLLGTFVVARHGIPFPTPIEVLLILVLFEMLREAGNRLPAGLGQTLAVVGGLIIGQAAIDAGLTSPTVLVVTGTTAVASFTLSNQALAGALTIFRIVILLFASILGEFGFLLGVFAVLIYLSTVRSFGVPYLSPLSPWRTNDVIATITSMGSKLSRKRPLILRTRKKS